MGETALAPLSTWENFYVIVGSSAGALTGLQFVVITLIAQAPGKGGPREIAAFGTPTIVHFCAVLLTAALISAPWHRLASTAFALGACGVLGLAYSIMVLVRARQQTGYRPVLEDWIWHTILPLVAYAALLVAAVALPRDPAPVLFVVAAASLLLLFVGIHNAWDAVTYVAVELVPKPDKPKND